MLYRKIVRCMELYTYPQSFTHKFYGQPSHLFKPLWVVHLLYNRRYLVDIIILLYTTVHSDIQPKYVT